MGLVYGTAKIFRDLCSDYKLTGALATLGHQRVLLTSLQVQRLFEIDRFTGKTQFSMEFHKRWQREFIDSRDFFGRCGFDLIDEFDVSSYEGANVPLDLNRLETPAACIGLYDLVFDGSTIEHIFCVTNAISHLVRMTRLGGCILHISPCNNFVNDGFFQFSPCFFSEFYEANGFKIESIYFHQQEIVQKADGDGVVFETTDSLIRMQDVEWTSDNPLVPAPTVNIGQPTQLVVLARKVNAFAEIRIPNQRRYASKSYWNEGLT